jgi:hypothetical protein
MDNELQFYWLIYRINVDTLSKNQQKKAPTQGGESRGRLPYCLRLPLREEKGGKHLASSENQTTQLIFISFKTSDLIFHLNHRST